MCVCGCGANEPAAGEQKVGVIIITQHSANKNWREKKKCFQATRNKATQLDHQELFRHVVGVGKCNDTMLLSLTGGGREIKSRIKRGPKGHNQEKRMGIITRQSRNHAITHAPHTFTHTFCGDQKKSSDDNSFSTIYRWISCSYFFFCASLCKIRRCRSQRCYCDEIIWRGDRKKDIILYNR